VDIGVTSILIHFYERKKKEEEEEKET